MGVSPVTNCDAFIILCDDDVLLPTCIEETVARMEESGADIVYTEFGQEQVTSLCRKDMWSRTCGFRSVGFFDWDFWWSCLEAGAESSVAVSEERWISLVSCARYRPVKPACLAGFYGVFRVLRLLL